MSVAERTTWEWGRGSLSSQGGRGGFREKRYHHHCIDSKVERPSDVHNTRVTTARSYDLVAQTSEFVRANINSGASSACFRESQSSTPFSKPVTFWRYDHERCARAANKKMITLRELIRVHLTASSTPEYQFRAMNCDTRNRGVYHTLLRVRASECLSLNYHGSFGGWQKVS